MKSEFQIKLNFLFLGHLGGSLPLLKLGIYFPSRKIQKSSGTEFIWNEDLMAGGAPWSGGLIISSGLGRSMVRISARLKKYIQIFDFSTNTWGIKNTQAVLVCTNIYVNGSIHRALHQLFQAKWLAFPHQIGEKRRGQVSGTYPALPLSLSEGSGRPIGLSGLQGEGGNRYGRPYSVIIYIHCIMQLR